MAEDGLIAEVVQKFRRIVDAVEQFAVLKGQFVGGALDVVEEDVEVVRVDERPLGRLAEEIVRWLTMYWSRGLDEATRIIRLLPPRRPARPACCQVLAMVPG